ncbi:hypothetical protein B296_00059180, partial [Ensete ventricosum]
QVSKYVPFGPVEQVMPYLLRRAEENRGLLCSSIVDRQLIRFMISNHCTTLSLLLCPASNFQNITLLCFLQEGDLEKTCHCSCLDDVVSLKSKVSDRRELHLCRIKRQRTKRKPATHETCTDLEPEAGAGDNQSAPYATLPIQSKAHIDI